jgi:hypothetical protein
MSVSQLTTDRHHQGKVLYVEREQNILSNTAQNKFENVTNSREISNQVLYACPA